MDRIIITLSNYNNINLENVSALDSHLVNDLKLIMENNFKVYELIKENAKNLAKKTKNGMFNYNKAVKGFYNIVVLYLDSYNKKDCFDNYFYNKSMVNVNDRFITAIELLESHYDLIEEYSNYMDNKELKKYMSLYKKELKSNLPSLKNNKTALEKELYFELDRLCKDNKISIEQYENFVI